MKKILFIIIVSSLFLSSCNSVRESAGVNRKVIDEYSVIENPPLVIPPNFNLLPPEQIKPKNIDDVESELAKEILFGLESEDTELKNNETLIKEIVKETEISNSDADIRTSIDSEFAGEKSSINDETIFETENDINNAILETNEKTNNQSELINQKEKKKKRFFFF